MLDTEKPEIDLASREHFVTAGAGSFISLNCTLGVNCPKLSYRWLHQSAFGSKMWYNGRNVHPSLEFRVDVDGQPARGVSVLSIRKARLADQGKFLCLIPGVKRCQMHFQLTLTGDCCNFLARVDLC